MIGTNKNDHNSELDLLLNLENGESSDLQYDQISMPQSNNNNKKNRPSIQLKNKRKCQEGLVRNKRCDQTADNNFSVGSNLIQLTKKKPIVIFIVLALLVIYLNSTVLSRTSNDKIPVIHHSTVPGMKGE